MKKLSLHSLSYRSLSVGLLFVLSLGAANRLAGQSYISATPPAVNGVVTRCASQPVAINASLYLVYGVPWQSGATVELFAKSGSDPWPSTPVASKSSPLIPPASANSVYSYSATFGGLNPSTVTQYRARFTYTAGLSATTKETAILTVTVPSFQIKRGTDGAFVSPNPDGSAIPVSLDKGVLVKANLGSCGSDYLFIVEESNQWWDRTFANEWARWAQVSTFNPPNTEYTVNLQQLTALNSSSDGTGFFTLLGGQLSSVRSPGNPALIGQERYYRVGLQLGSGWSPTYALIKVDW